MQRRSAPTTKAKAKITKKMSSPEASQHNAGGVMVEISPRINDPGEA